MPLVEVDPVDDALDRLVERGVVEDDVRRLPAELERQAHVPPGELAHDQLADLGGTGERDLVDALVLDEMPAGRAVARDDVHDAGRKLRLPADIGEEESGQRRRLGRLQHDRVPARERRRDLPREHEQREVPGDDLRGDTDGPRRPVRKRVLELVGPPRVVEEVRRGERQVDVARLADRLAAVERLGHGELARALLEDARDTEEVLRALRGRDLAPAVLERAERAAVTARLDVLRPGERELEQLLLRRRRDRRERLTRPRLDLLAADEQAVALADLDDVARLRRRRVLPLERRRYGGGPLLDLGHQSMVK